VSRLYDRVLVGGCRRATTADFHDLVDRATDGRRDWDEFAKSVSAMLIDSGVIEHPVNAATARELHRANLAESRSKVAEQDFSVDALRRSVVIAGDEVSAYIHSLPGPVDLASVCGVVAPPFEWFWVDCRSPNRFSLHSWGVLVHGLDVPPDQAQDGERWLLRASLVFETRKGDPWGPVGTFVVPVAPDGHLWPRDDEGRGSVFGYPASCVGEDDDQELWIEELPQYLFSALMTVSFLHCKNVDRIEVEPSEKLSRAYQRRHGRPLTRYWVLDIEPMKRVLARDGQAEQRGLGHALHICRGHFKTFTADAPLFGKMTGTYWWADQVRGASDLGVVDKDYRVRIEDGSLGRPYEPVEEHHERLSAPESKGSDPDLAGRGKAAHDRTQNLLAAAVERAGHQPLRPKPEEPQFDLAWETAIEVWVTEVKSLTQENEMRQMHAAIGQVIDYGHRLDAGDRRVRLLIALEREPFSNHWMAECSRYGITLAWPEMFAAVVA
jgi:hypothetical protein